VVSKAKSLTTLEDYYAFKEQYKGQEVIKINNIPRDLKPARFI